jgi:quercetin dioxygenase-like cupin family protein
MADGPAEPSQWFNLAKKTINKSYGHKSLVHYGRHARIGAEIPKAAPDNGNRVVATGCKPEAVTETLRHIPLPQRQESNMEIKRNGSQPSSKGPADWFTGTVRIDPLFQANAPARASGATVTFEPGARTAWHTHPLGQTLIVTAGCGRVQREGGPIEEIHPGDVICLPPGEKHWHGAAPTTAVTHIAIQEQLDGKLVDWMEKVSDEQYRR